MDFVIAPGGRADAAGTVAEPFGTFAQAQSAVRALRQAQPDRVEPIVVGLRGGRYVLEESVRFEPADSGTADSPVIYRAWPGEQPILHGGRRISDWRVDQRGWWTAELPEVREGWWFRQLHVDGERRYRTRLPRHGYYTIADRRRPTPPDPAGVLQGDDRFAYWPGDLRRDWSNLDDVELMVVHLWNMSRLAIAELDEARHEARTRSRSWSTKIHGNLARGHRYAVENVREALGEPGRWCLDRKASELVYVPLEGERPESVEVIAPRLEHLVEFAGEPGRGVEHLRFEGLTFEQSDWRMQGAGQSVPQCDINVSAAIEGRHAHHLAFERCAVRQTSNYAMAFYEGCSHVRVERCDLYDLGAGGVKFGDWRMHDTHPADPVPRDPQQIVHDCVVRDCRIAHGGRVHPAGVGVWVGHAHDNTVEHNTIEDFYYSGVNVGWVWGYGASPAHHNTVAYNRIGPLGHGVLSDMGGIYCLGRSPGTELHHNVIHHVHSYDYGGWGLYLDEGSSGILCHSNVVYRTTDGGFAQHFGRDNRFENNIFAFSLHKQLSRANREDVVSSLTFERNIVYWTVGPLHDAEWTGHGVLCDRNVYYNALAEPIRFAGTMSFEQWQRFGQDMNSVVADPGFVDAAGDDYRLKPESAALAIGYEPWDHAEAGIRTPRASALPQVPHAWPRQAPLEYTQPQ